MADRYVFVCPGVRDSGRGPTAGTVHASGCCARFESLSLVEQVTTGLRIPRTDVPARPTMTEPGS